MNDIASNGRARRALQVHTTDLTATLSFSKSPSTTMASGVGATRVLNHAYIRTLRRAPAPGERPLRRIHPYIHTSIHPYIHTSIRPSIHPDIQTSSHPYIHTSIHPYIHTYIHPHIHPYIRAHAASRSGVRGASAQAAAAGVGAARHRLPVAPEQHLWAQRRRPEQRGVPDGGEKPV